MASTPAEIQTSMESLIVARISILMRNAFFGNLVTRLQLKVKEDIETAATDGRSIFFNPAFINKLKKKDCEFVCLHEILHAILEHAGVDSRLVGRDPRVWNIAADFCVNLMAVEQGYPLPTTVPVLFDKKYTEWSTEAIYDDLIQSKSEAEIESMTGKLLDEHLKDSESGDSEGGQITPEQRQSIRDDMREALLSAASSASAGDVPSGIKRMLDMFTEPKMNWRELLQQQIESQITYDFSYARPSRKGWSIDAILPSTTREPTVECTIAIDTSGSVTGEMVRDFLSEVNGIMSQHAAFKIGVFTFDTQVYNYQEYDENNSDELLDYEIHGGGGTMFECIFKFLEDSDIGPKQLAILTDMYPCGSWGDPEYCQTIFIAHKTDIVAPYGTTVKYV